MLVGRNNGVVGLTGFSNKRMRGLLFGPQKSGRNKGLHGRINGVVVWRGSTVFSDRPCCPPVSLRSSVTKET